MKNVYDIATGNSSARGTSTKGTIPLKKLIADNKYLQIQIQCSSALDKSAFRQISSAMSGARQHLHQVEQAMQAPQSPQFNTIKVNPFSAAKKQYLENP